MAKAKAKVAPPVKIPKVPTAPERVPRVVANPTLDDHLRVIAKAVFQAGLSWAFIDARWESYLAAFENFAVAKVAQYDDAARERLMQADGVIRSAAKINGIIHNALALQTIEREFGSIRAYQESLPDYAAARKDAQKRFKYMGDLNVYYWRFLTGASVPPLEEWMKGQERDHPRMREMVTAAAASA
jgi:3-methyladenine DNA glycosylase Tag